jgi:hypothetical protein
MIDLTFRHETADELREQAATCRRLARNARTAAGRTALAAVADYFDRDAWRIDSLSYPG